MLILMRSSICMISSGACDFFLVEYAEGLGWKALLRRPRGARMKVRIEWMLETR